MIPFPVDKLDYAPFKVDYAHSGRRPDGGRAAHQGGLGVKGQTFFINIKKFGKGDKARWLVDNWVPRGSAPIPDGTLPRR